MHSPTTPRPRADNAGEAMERLLARYPDLLAILDRTITRERFFETFKALSDNYSPTLTVSRVQGPLVEKLAGGAETPRPIRVDRNLRGAGTIGVAVGKGPAPVWLSAHGDICSYLTGSWNGEGYDLTPFCTHRASPGRRAAVALDLPRGHGPLAHLAEGEIVTDEGGRLTFATEQRDLPRWTRVVHYLPATWDPASDVIHGFIDNQAGSAALLLAARALAHFDASALFLINDEEEGPVDRGNQTFSRAKSRLLNRTPHAELPQLDFVVDVHQQESIVQAEGKGHFGSGASYTGTSSQARGAVTPPQLLGFTRELATVLGNYDISLFENGAYVNRSDDVSAIQYTPNINLIGFPGIYGHFDRTPSAHCGDLVHLAKVLVIYALVAQDPEWRESYL